MNAVVRQLDTDIVALRETIKTFFLVLSHKFGNGLRNVDGNNSSSTMNGGGSGIVGDVAKRMHGLILHACQDGINSSTISSSSSTTSSVAPTPIPYFPPALPGIKGIMVASMGHYIVRCVYYVLRLMMILD